MVSILDERSVPVPSCRATRLTRWSAAVVVVPTAAALAASVPTPGRPASASPLVRAVVMVRPGVPLPLRVAGGRIATVLPHVGAEVVVAPVDAVRRLATDPAVVGVSPDRQGNVDGASSSTSGTGVLVADVLGGAAGKSRTGQGVNVALLDTGVSDTAALNRASGRITDGVDVSRLAAGGPALTSGTFTDGFGHGTFLASLIAGGRVAGSGNRGVGVAPGARIVVVKVADADGRTSLSQVLAGLDWVAAHARAIQVVNIALSVDRPTAPAYGADPLTAAVEHVRDAGVLPVVAAGNVAGQVGDPGLDPRVLTVGAASVEGRQVSVAPFSGSGVVAGVAKPDVVAPGVHVLGLLGADSAIAQAHPDAWQQDGLFRGSGTSEATAITSGVAAAYFSDHPDATPGQAKAALRGRAHKVDDVRAGTGMVDLAPGESGHGDAADGDGHGPNGADATGEASFDASSWSANAWLASSWSSWLASSWSGPAWDASSWSASSWSASSWSASSWSASSWSASSWSASSWSASSWSAAGWGEQ